MAQQPLPNIGISEQGMRELELWLDKTLNWTPWVYFGTYPDDVNTTPRSPAFQSGWDNVGGGQQRLRFRRTVPHKGQKINSLEIEGQITGGAVDSLVGTLPETFRPKESALLLGPTADPGVAVWSLDTLGRLVFLGTVSGSGGVTFGIPAITLGTTAAAGSIAEAIRRDSQVIAFDATVPTTQAFGDSAATGSVAFAARRDHKHAMPATPVTTFRKSGDTLLTGAVTLSEGTNVTLTQVGQDIEIASSGSGGGSCCEILVTDTPAGSPLIFADLLQNEAGTDLIYSDP